MNKTTWSDKVQLVLKHFQSERVFSHAYAASGLLSLTDVPAEAAVLPDGAAIFDLASTTKALVTTPLFFQLKRLKHLNFSMTIGDWLGGLASDLSSPIKTLSIRSLLRHDSGLPAWHNFWICHLGLDNAHEQTRVRFQQRIVEGLNRVVAAQRLMPSAQAKQLYSDVGLLLLGLGLERSTGKVINTLFYEFCADEFNLHTGESVTEWPLGFGPDLRKEGAMPPQQFVPTAFCQLRQRELRGEVHDENCASFLGVSAHSGLFSTGPGFVRYLKALAASPTGTLMLQENAREVVAPQKCSEPAGDLRSANTSLLGMRQGSDSVATAFGGGGSMGHYGFTGTAFWIEPNSGPIGTWRYVVLLTNRVRFGRVPVAGQGIALCRKEVFEISQQLTEI